jgi:hypothetical protein
LLARYELALITMSKNRVPPAAKQIATKGMNKRPWTKHFQNVFDAIWL